MIYCILGNSGAGKTTVVRELLKREDLKLLQIPQITTRPIRDGEVDGDEYNFASDSLYDRLLNMRVLTCEQVITAKNWRYAILETGATFSRFDYIISASVPLFKSICATYGSYSTIVLPIVLRVDDERRKQRMFDHNDDSEEINRRFTGDQNLINFDEVNPAFIVDNNGDIKDTVNAITAQMRGNMFNTDINQFKWHINPELQPITFYNLHSVLREFL